MPKKKNLDMEAPLTTAKTREHQKNVGVIERKNLSGVALVRYVIDCINNLPGRLADDEGKPGGLVLFPQDKKPIIIGDLHANVENLQKILDHGTNREDLEKKEAACIFLGDILHDDRTGYMKDMKSSVAILDVLFELFVQYPGQIYYIRGNHDSFDERLRKSGISQGVEFKKELIAQKGEAYAEAVGDFFESLPVFIIGEGFVITHAGPPRGGVVREELINIKKYPEKLHQLLWNRVNEFHGNPSLKEYGEKDIRLCLELLGLPLDSHFIVGHTPLWNDGNETGVWMNVIGIKNHHILYSGSGSRAPYFTFEEGNLVVHFAIPKPAEVYYYG